MSGPWERYQKQSGATEGPWKKYQATPVVSESSEESGIAGTGLRKLAQVAMFPLRAGRAYGVGAKHLLSGESPGYAAERFSAAVQPGYKAEPGESLAAFAGETAATIPIMAMTGGSASLGLGAQMARGALSAGTLTALNEASERGDIDILDTGFSATMGGVVPLIGPSLKVVAKAVRGFGRVAATAGTTLKQSTVDVALENPKLLEAYRGTARAVGEKVKYIQETFLDQMDKAGKALAAVRKRAGITEPIGQAIDRIGEQGLKSPPIQEVIGAFKEVQRRVGVLSTRLGRTPAFKQALLKDLYQLRKNVDDYIKYPPANVGADVPSISTVEQGTIKAIRRRVNGMIDKVPGGKPLRKADEAYSEAREVYDELQKQLATQGSGEDFVRRLLSGEEVGSILGKRWERLNILQDLEKSSRRKLIGPMRKELAAKDLRDMKATGWSGLIPASIGPQGTQTLLRGTDMAGRAVGAVGELLSSPAVRGAMQALGVEIPQQLGPSPQSAQASSFLNPLLGAAQRLAQKLDPFAHAGRALDATQEAMTGGVSEALSGAGHPGAAEAAGYAGSAIGSLMEVARPWYDPEMGALGSVDLAAIPLSGRLKGQRVSPKRLASGKPFIGDLWRVGEGKRPTTFWIDEDQVPAAKGHEGVREAMHLTDRAPIQKRRYQFENPLVARDKHDAWESLGIKPRDILSDALKLSRGKMSSIAFKERWGVSLPRGYIKYLQAYKDEPVAELSGLLDFQAQIFDILGTKIAAQRGVDGIVLQRGDTIDIDGQQAFLNPASEIITLSNPGGGPKAVGAMAADWKGKGLGAVGQTLKKADDVFRSHFDARNEPMGMFFAEIQKKGYKVSESVLERYKEYQGQSLLDSPEYLKFVVTSPDGRHGALRVHPQGAQGSIVEFAPTKENSQVGGLSRTEDLTEFWENHPPLKPFSVEKLNIKELLSDPTFKGFANSQESKSIFQKIGEELRKDLERSSLEDVESFNARIDAKYANFWTDTIGNIQRVYKQIKKSKNDEQAWVTAVKEAIRRSGLSGDFSLKAKKAWIDYLSQMQMYYGRE